MHGYMWVYRCAGYEILRGPWRRKRILKEVGNGIQAEWKQMGDYHGEKLEQQEWEGMLGEGQEEEY